MPEYIVFWPAHEADKPALVRLIAQNDDRMGVITIMPTLYGGELTITGSDDTHIVDHLGEYCSILGTNGRCDGTSFGTARLDQGGVLNEERCWIAARSRAGIEEGEVPAPVELVGCKWCDQDFKYMRELTSHAERVHAQLYWEAVRRPPR